MINGFALPPIEKRIHATNLNRRPNIKILTVTTKNMIFGRKIFVESGIPVSMHVTTKLFGLFL